MSNSTSRVEGRLLARVYKDLAELQDNPYPGVTVFTDDADFRQLCLVLTPPSGPWKDLALHFDVALPNDWPTAPPKVSSSVYGIQHPNLFGDYICCDLLNPLEHRSKGYSGGYTPALTLRGLFLQFLTFFSSTRIEQDTGGYIEIGDHIAVCYVLGPEVLNHWPPEGYCSCRTSDARKLDQETLKALWESDPTDEVVVKLFSSWLGNFEEKASDSIKSVLYQNQTVHKIQRTNYRWTSTYQAISRWTCKKCPYGSPTLPRHQANGGAENKEDSLLPVTLLRPPATCKLSNLHDNALAELASILPSESIITLSTAYPRFRHVATFLHSLLRLELRCFFLRAPLNDCILGIGIRLDGRKLFSDFDWLSMEAFDSFNVRDSIEKRSFAYFLPIAFNSSHFERARVTIWNRLGLLDNALRRAEVEHSRKARRPSNRRLEPPIQAHHTIEVVFRMMNSIVVSLMESCDDTMQPKKNHHSRTSTLLHASEKAIISYCHLLHLAIRLCRSTPAILQDATQKLRDFIDKPETRHKKGTPDLGELIISVTLVLVLPPIVPNKPITWEALCGKFLEEATMRNVLWVLKATPELEVMETGPSDYRLNNTFNNSKTSLRLIMFQICFLRLFIQTYSSNLSRLDDSYGFAEKELPERVVTEIRSIYKVESWPMYFRCIQFSKGLSLSKAAFCDMLRGAVQQSAARQYHMPANKSKMEEMKGKRAKLDKMIPK